MFVQENIETLKRAFTDKYVVVKGDRPELRRFEGYTGLVKTVNMSGRALVQFDAWSNIGWYDIELDFLEVVPKPDPDGAGKKEPTKAAAAPAAKAEAPTAAAAPSAAAKKSTAAPAAEAKAAPAKPAAAAGPTTLTKGQRATVAQMLAFCREHDAAK